MKNKTSEGNRDAGLDPNAKIRVPLATGLGAQLAIHVLPGVVLIPTVVFRAAGAPDPALVWAVFASVVICGVIAILQAQRLGRIGAGYILATGTAGVSISVAVAALDQGGPALLSALMVALALCQFAFSARLSLFRQILTPTVTGTVLMLTPVTVMPVIFEQLGNVLEGAAPVGAILSAGTTVLVIAAIVLKADRVTRLWAPIIGIVAGSAVGATFGLYDVERIASAPWIGIPPPAWPGLGFEFRLEFWALLPSFVFIAFVCTIQTVSGAVAIQRVSRAQRRAVDFRAVQGAVTADGLGNLLSGLAGTMTLGFRPNGTTMVEITGVSSRRIGVALGASLIGIALSPKVLAVVLAIPGPVIAAFITITMATIFVIGMKLIVQDGMDYRQGLIAGLAFWLGTGFEGDVIFPEWVAGFAGGFLSNGMVAGGLAALLLTLLVELTKPRRSRIELDLDPSALLAIREFNGALATRNGWDADMQNRLDAASEETLLTLLSQDEEREDVQHRRLRLVARREGEGALLEFVAAGREENLEDQISILGEENAESAIEREVSLRMLRHLSSSVRHQQYHDTDIVTVRVDPAGAGSKRRS
ncbi:MAG: hypothetical protein OXI22_03530 [Defluviicoccus sp.]|nr:hypothetical protein [Defluviicoccus sp.]MDE0382932.1 hypothetical protein [Defluviicoccus sp.]